MAIPISAIYLFTVASWLGSIWSTGSFSQRIKFLERTAFPTVRNHGKDVVFSPGHSQLQCVNWLFIEYLNTYISTTHCYITLHWTLLRCCIESIYMSPFSLFPAMTSLPVQEGVPEVMTKQRAQPTLESWNLGRLKYRSNQVPQIQL